MPFGKHVCDNRHDTGGDGTDRDITLAASNFSPDLTQGPQQSTANELQLLLSSALMPGYYKVFLAGDSTKGLQVLCVNPAALGGGTAALSPYFPTTPPGSAPTPWVSFPTLYTAACKHTGNTTWLQVNDIGSHSDKRPRVSSDGAER